MEGYSITSVVIVGVVIGIVLAIFGITLVKNTLLFFVLAIVLNVVFQPLISRRG